MNYERADVVVLYDKNEQFKDVVVIGCDGKAATKDITDIQVYVGNTYKTPVTKILEDLKDNHGEQAVTAFNKAY